MKERGLRKDSNDQSKLRHGRDRYIGWSLENEYYQPVPMFFSAEGNSFPGLVGNYKGAHAFLICGGPSFKELDHSHLDRCWTMALNNSPITYRPNAWCSVDDPARFAKSIWLDPTIMKFVPFDHTEKELWDNSPANWGPLNKKVRECPNVVYYRRNEKFEPKRFLFEMTFNWGDHSKWGGGRSCMLPALKTMFLLGFRNVYLLGCDLNMDGSNKYHFHEQRTKGAQNGNNNTYKKMIETYYPKLKPEFDNHGFKVYNCNKNSKLEVFPYLPYSEAISRASGPLDIDTEISYGMYKKYGEKVAECEKIKNKIKSGDYPPKK